MKQATSNSEARLENVDSDENDEIHFISMPFIVNLQNLNAHLRMHYANSIKSVFSNMQARGFH